MSAKLKKAWRFWQDGCRPVDFPAGSVIEDEEVAKIARQCGVVEEEAAPVPEKKPRKKKGD